MNNVGYPNTDKVLFCTHMLHDVAQAFPKTMQAFFQIEFDLDSTGDNRVTFWCSRWRYQDLDITKDDIQEMMFQCFDIMTWNTDDDTGLIRGDGDIPHYGVQIRCFMID
jgi:hypothetical protein